MNKIDPVCDVFSDNKGNFILLANGEIHLERCLRDLKNDFFTGEIVTSEMLVDFRETVSFKKFIIHKKTKDAMVFEEDKEDS